jgi:hypothetical protein
VNKISHVSAYEKTPSRVVASHLRSCLLFELRAKVQAASAYLQTLRLLCSANKRLHNTNALYTVLPDIRVNLEHPSISKATLNTPISKYTNFAGHSHELIITWQIALHSIVCRTRFTPSRARHASLHLVQNMLHSILCRTRFTSPRARVLVARTLVLGDKNHTC